MGEKAHLMPIRRHRIFIVTINCARTYGRKICARSNACVEGRRREKWDGLNAAPIAYPFSYLQFSESITIARRFEGNTENLPPINYFESCSGGVGGLLPCVAPLKPRGDPDASICCRWTGFPRKFSVFGSCAEFEAMGANVVWHSPKSVN